MCQIGKRFRVICIFTFIGLLGGGCYGDEEILSLHIIMIVLAFVKEIEAIISESLQGTCIILILFAPLSKSVHSFSQHDN